MAPPRPAAAGRALRLLPAAVGLLSAACAVAPPPPVTPSGHGPAVASTPTPRRPPPRPPPGAGVSVAGAPASTFAALLPGWAEEDHVEALRAYQAGCAASRSVAGRTVCARARALSPRTPDGAARQFFEFNFRPEVIEGEGVLTAYFAPEYPARRTPDALFDAPVRPRPRPGTWIPAAAEEPAPSPDAPPPEEEAAPSAPADDPLDLLLRDAPAAPAPQPLLTADRAAIDRAPAPDALAWMRPEDLFFLQIQGSGVLVFPDGDRRKAAYAADNGRPFVAISRPMVRSGRLAPDRAGGEAIRAWLAAHAGAQAQAVMDLDPRYVFFSLRADDGRDPAGAAGVPLPPGRSLAVDPSRHGYGELYWVDAAAPVLTGAPKRYRRLAMALDTGSAIKGEVRADLYVGRGAAAGVEAGRVRHTLRLVRLVPTPMFGGG